MAGFANAIAGAGQQAGQLGSQVRAQNFAHQENALKQVQEQYNNLADALGRTKAQYAAAPDIVNRLNDVEMQIRAAHMPGQPVDAQSYQKLLGQYLKAKQEANQAWAVHPSNPANRVIGTPAVQNAVAQATGQAGVQPVVPTATPPFAPQIAQPGGPPAAQPATSPVQPAAQGGGSSSGATFPTTPVPPAAAAAVEPVAPDSSVPPLTASTGGASVAPVVPLDDLLARSMAGYQDTGIMSPQLNAALGHQMGTQAALERLYRTGGINLQLGKKKLEAIQPMLEDMSTHPENLLKDLMGIETLTGGQGSSLALGPMLAALNPRSIPGQETVASAEARYPGFLAAHGYDVSKLDPNQPVRVQTSKLPPYAPLSIEVSAYRSPLTTTAEGFSPYDPYSHVLSPPIQGATPPVMAPTTSVQNIPGQLPQTTTRTKGAPSKAAPASLGLPPVRPSGGGGGTSKAAPGPAGGGSSVVANNYNDWIAGKATLSDKEQTAARAYAHATGQPTPDMLNPSGQKAIAQLQPIANEIQHALELLKERGLDTMSEGQSKLALGTAYGKYSYLKVDDPLAKAISDLSFDSLRSVGQALQGTGSRAYPIFVRGLEHTPVIGLNSDSGKLIADKLVGMQRRVQEAIDAAKTETKSGIIPPVSPVKAGGGPTAGTVEDGYRFKGGDPAKKENWERVQ